MFCDKLSINRLIVTFVDVVLVFFIVDFEQMLAHIEL